MSRFKKAQRTQTRLRMALDGPPKSGKSFNSLLFAHAMARLFYPDQPTANVIAVIDTERGSASKYVGERVGGDPDAAPWDFFVCELDNFKPTEYTAAIHDAEREGFKIIVVDSLSHAWAGKDGALELKDKSGEANSFTAWKNITPMHNEMIEAILQSPCHVFATMRSKIEHVLEDGVGRDGRAIKVPRKVGMAPVQRSGMEYEFDIYASMDQSHVLTVSGTRCRAIDGAVVPFPGADFMRPVCEWLTTGNTVDFEAVARVQRASREQITEIVRLTVELKKAKERVEAEISKRYGVSEFANLKPDQADDFIDRLTAEWRNMPRATATMANGVAAPTTNGTPTQPPLDPGPRQSLHEALAEQSEESLNPLATADQLARMKTLRDEMIELGVMDAERWKNAMTKRGVVSATELTTEQADEVLAKMETAIADAKQQAAKAPEATGQQGQEASQSAPADPTSPPETPTQAPTPNDVDVSPPKKPRKAKKEATGEPTSQTA